MKTLNSACAVLPSGDGVQGKKAGKRAAGNPQQRFAVIVALAGVKAGRTPNKATVSKPATTAVPRSEQVATEVRKRGNRSVPDKDQTVTGFRLVGQPVDPPLASQRRLIERTNSAYTLAPNNVAPRTEDGGQRGTLHTRVPDRVLHTRIVRPAGLTAQAQPNRPEDPHSGATYTPLPKETALVKNAHPEAIRGRGVPVPEKVEFGPEARATKPVVISVRAGAETKSLHGESRDTEAAPVTQITRRGTDVKEQGRVVGQPAESEYVVKDGGVPGGEDRARRQSGSQVAAKDDGSKKSCAAPPSAKVYWAVSPERADRAGVEATRTFRAPAVGVQQEFNRSVQSPPMKEQPHPRSQRSGGPGRQEARTEAAQPRVSEVRPAGPKEKGSVPREPPAPHIGGQSVTTALPPALEAPTRGVAQGMGDGMNNPVRELGEQILDSLQASVTQGQRQVTIRLQPSELGMVLVRFREQGEQLDGVLEVAKTETRRRIEQALPEVVRSLQDAGIAIRRLDVTSGESSAQEFGRDLSQQDVWSGQYGSSHNQDHFPASQAMRPQLAGPYAADSQETPSADCPQTTAHGRIDVLL